jgi:ParB family chromosome partitioning protein
MSIELKQVPLRDIKPDPKQPRKHFDQTAIDELAENIAQHDVLQPILLRPSGKGYMIVFGERRYRACLKAGKETIPATIKQMSDTDALEIQLMENLQRENPHPMEEAVAFKAYLELKQYTMEEIAAKLGKKVYYIRQRIKLNELIDKWQKLFFQNSLMITDALKIAQLPADAQQELYDDEVNEVLMQRPHYKVHFNGYEFDKYRGDLENAKFDTTDKKLHEKVGSCTACKFNTAYATLFVDDTKARCTNIGCFKTKQKLAFDKKLQDAKQDPTIVLLKSNHTEENSKLVKELQKKDVPVVKSGKDCVVIHKPERPDYQEFLNDNDMMDYSDEEMQAAYQKELTNYDEQLKDYQKKIDTGKYQKAFIIDGYESGETVFVELKKTELEAQLANDPNAAINQEIERIKQTEEQYLENDAIAVHKKIKDHLVNFQPFVTNNFQLNRYEVMALVVMLYDYSSPDVFSRQFKIDRGNKLDLFTKLMAMPPELSVLLMNTFLRAVLIQRMASKDSKDSPLTSGTAAAIKQIADHYFPDMVNQIFEEQNKVAVKRSATANKKIEELKQQLDTARMNKKKVKPVK